VRKDREPIQANRGKRRGIGKRVPGKKKKVFALQGELVQTARNIRKGGKEGEGKEWWEAKEKPAENR